MLLLSCDGEVKLNPDDAGEKEKLFAFFSLTDEAAPASSLAAPPNTKFAAVACAGPASGAETFTAP